jgi:hypothetical protein
MGNQVNRSTSAAVMKEVTNGDEWVEVGTIRGFGTQKTSCDQLRPRFDAQLAFEGVR